jgi:shikimate kinase
VISLVGMPGGGKSTIGRHLARRLGFLFADSDHVLEHRLGCDIRAFFEREGEERFREVEAEVLIDLLDAGNTVLATGGGMVIRPANRLALRERSHGVYLRSTPEELFRRLRHDTRRPLLQVADPLTRLRELHAQRDALYADAARFAIDTGRPSIPTLVNMILMQLELGGVLDPGKAPGE